MVLQHAPIASAPADSAPGTRIRFWRNLRGVSQMTLALDVHVSPRHMSFVETGRSRPSRALLLRIADRLLIPHREQNVLLEAAGYARRFRESGLDDTALIHVRRALRFILERHEPYPALVFDGDWDIVMANEAHHMSRDFFVDETAPDEVRTNLLRLTFHPLGLRPFITNWDVVGPVLLQRVERELVEAPSAGRLRALFDEVRGYGPVPSLARSELASAGALLPVQLERDGARMKLFSVLSTLGTALDVTLQELRLESFFPADDGTASLLNGLAAAVSP